MTVEQYIESLMNKEIISNGQEVLEYISEVRQEESRPDIVLELYLNPFDNGDGNIEIKIDNMDNVNEKSTNEFLKGLICHKVQWMCAYDWGRGEEAVGELEVCLETYKKGKELIEKI